MDTLKLVITILQLLCGLAIILVVLFQSGKSEGLSGAIGGVADSFLAKNKARTMDAKLARATKWVGAVFLILTTERYFWLIFSWNYGVELHDLIGKDPEYCIPEIERRITEALLQDDRITAVENFQFEVNKKNVLTTFTVISIFGNVDVKKEVEI